MSANSDLILAGINGGGTAGNALAYFAPTGTAAPTDGTAAPGVGFKDAGWCSENGLVSKFTESSTDIKGFGSFQPVRTIVTESKQEFDIEFLESNLTTLEIYHRKTLGSLVATAGAVDFTTGAASTENVSAIFDMVDGTNHIRAYCPKIAVTNRGDLNIRNGQVVSYPVTLTAYPGTDGVSVHWYYVVSALT